MVSVGHVPPNAESSIAMMSFARCVPALAGFLLLLSAAGCRNDADVSTTDDGRLVLGAAEAEETLSRTVAPGNRTLVLEGFSGSVYLTATTEPTASIDFIKRARGSDDAEARERLNRIAVAESGNETAYTYLVSSDDANMSSVDIRGTVPRNAGVRVILQNGDITLSGLEGPISIDNRNGDIEIKGAAASVNARTESGSVTIGMRGVPPDAAVEARTTNGDVALTLPGNSSVRVEASTSAGDILTQSLRFVNPRLDSQGAGTRFTGQLGRGSARIVAETRNGDIQLQEGTVYGDPAPATDAADSLRPPTPMLPDTTRRSRGDTISTI